MDLIVQRAAHDCGICSIAMATGRNYDDVLAAATDAGCYRPNSGIRNETQVLERLGLLQGGHSQAGLMGDFIHLDVGILMGTFFRLFAWGRRALMAVPSLNTEGSLHSIYFDGRRPWDPHPERRYEHFDQLLPVELILFREGRR